jgi:low temperature requirement protein LtrA
MTEQVWNVYSVNIYSLELCISFSLWWLYFDSTERLPIQLLREKGRISLFSIWLFTHFPLVVAITAVGVGLRRLVSSEQHSVLSTSIL